MPENGPSTKAHDQVYELRWPGDLQCESGQFARIDSRESICRKTLIFHSLRIYPYPMVWPLLRPWPETMVSTTLKPSLSTENPRNKGLSGSGAPIFGFGLADPAPKGEG